MADFDATPVSFHPGGDRNAAAQTAPAPSALGFAVDSAANTEAIALRIEAKVNSLSAPVTLTDIRTFPTAALLAELARRLNT